MTKKLIVAFRNFANGPKKKACAVIWNKQAFVALLDTVTCIKGQTYQKLIFVCTCYCTLHYFPHTNLIQYFEA